AARTFLLLEAAAVHGHEARAEALHAAEVLVAIALVDAALASEFGFQRQHRHAVGGHAAVAAAFADGLVDHRALWRIDHLAALAAAALFRSAGLVVNDDGDAGQFAQALGHGIEFVAMQEFHAVREDLRLRPFFDVVGEYDDRLHAFAAHLVRDIGHGQRAVDRLAAGHRHRIVVENLVGDVH